MKRGIRSSIFLGYFIACLLSIVVLDTFGATRDNPEDYYVKQVCTDGIIEFQNSDGTRTDCLTDTHSIEFDFANKWYECLTQAAYYSILNNNLPACFLIMENPEKDNKYLERALQLTKQYNFPVLVIPVNSSSF